MGHAHLHICLGPINSTAQLQLYEQAFLAEGNRPRSLNRALETRTIASLLSVDFLNVPRYALGDRFKCYNLLAKLEVYGDQTQSRCSSQLKNVVFPKKLPGHSQLCSTRTAEVASLERSGRTTISEERLQKPQLQKPSSNSSEKNHALFFFYMVWRKFQVPVRAQ